MGLLSSLFGWRQDVDDDGQDEVLVCWRCGGTDDVELGLDPYALEVDDEREEMALCPECFQERLWDS